MTTGTVRSKEEPGWSEEGGGHGPQHLLVTEAAPEAAETGRPVREFTEWDLKVAQFKDEGALSLQLHSI